MTRDDRSISELFDDDELIEKALSDAVRDALLDHKRAGNPVCEWRDGKVVWIQPEDINLDDFDRPPKRPPEQP